MTGERQHINRFGFVEKPDMADLAAQLDASALAVTMEAVIDIVLERDEDFIDTLSDAAQADFVVPLQLATRLFKAGDYTPIELVSAACTVRYCAAPHLADFPEELVELLRQLPH
ncbi:hypothetical protein KDK95_25585 [Actinospica sp. MGRD01-02]|uniref:Uncharacterized protein n=1 Tax=Actinospica acidithermotolerans TaxID=2828514 RepID=A0A941EIH3_9ACTN|nr:hypothetical protein [Actinospica acidithermotolerans]MBR7829704.1 hypothetical protein [Actinospica acidithermotolerans]